MLGRFASPPPFLENTRSCHRKDDDATAQCLSCPRLGRRWPHLDSSGAQRGVQHAAPDAAEGPSRCGHFATKTSQCTFPERRDGANICSLRQRSRVGMRRSSQLGGDRWDICMASLPRADWLEGSVVSLEGRCVPQDGARLVVESFRANTPARRPREQNVDGTTMGRPDPSNLRLTRLRILSLAGGCSKAPRVWEHNFVC